MANKAVAELCNHKKTVSSTHAQTMANAQNRVNAQRMKAKVLERELVLRKKILKIRCGKLDPKLEYELNVKTEDGHKVKIEPEPELKVKAELEVKREEREEEDQMNSMVGLDRADIKKEPKVDVKGKISNETVEEEEEILKVKELKKTDKDGLKKRVEECKKRLKDALAKVEKAESDATLKEEMKEIALGTSKLNYLDPRITVQWCKTHEVPLEKVIIDVKRLSHCLAPDFDSKSKSF